MESEFSDKGLQGLGTHLYGSRAFENSGTEKQKNTVATAKGKTGGGLRNGKEGGATYLNPKETPTTPTAKKDRRAGDGVQRLEG